MSMCLEGLSYIRGREASGELALGRVAAGTVRQARGTAVHGQCRRADASE